MNADALQMTVAEPGALVMYGGRKIGKLQ